MDRSVSASANSPGAESTSVFCADKISKQALALRLAVLQRQLQAAKLPVLVIFEGWESSGKGTLIKEVIKEMDPRFFTVQVFEKPTQEELRHPFLWRFWKKLPAQGEIALFDRSFYQQLMERSLSSDQRKDSIEDIAALEKMLTEENMLIVKFFLEISEKTQKERIDKLSQDEATAFRITHTDHDQNHHYSKYQALFGEMIAKTDFDFCPWQVVEAESRKKAAVQVLTTLVERIEAALERSSKSAGQSAVTGVGVQAPEANWNRVPQALPEGTAGAVESAQSQDSQSAMQSFAPAGQPLEQVDLSQSLSEERYEAIIEDLQAQAEQMAYRLYRAKIPMIIAFEGWDAAGKGGAIKRLTRQMDPRGYQVHPISAPNETEKRYHYLWRFFQHFSKSGHITVFDRTWYGRVLVERVEGFASTQQYRRAYHEINQMEKHLAHHQTVILKFYLHISSQVQLARFEERASNPEKNYKITAEDWRNRQKWHDYEEAVNEMLLRTSTPYAPWIIVEGDDKRHARVKVLQIFLKAAEKALSGSLK